MTQTAASQRSWVLALIVVQALAESPWGLTTIALSVPIAIVMGFWMRVWRAGKVLEASIALIVVESARQWYLLLTHRRAADLKEAPVVRSRFMTAIGYAIAELFGEHDYER